ncbi:hypothetical protein AYI70_g12453, partial [Smittium culicis]
MPELCVGSFDVILGDSISEKPSKKFYEIKDKLTRSIPKVNLDVLNEATVAKARKISSAKGSESPHKFLLEAESKKYGRLCTYEGSIKPKVEDKTVNCVLLYDPIKKVLVLEKIEEKIELVSGSGMSLSLRGNSSLPSNPASELALPSKRLSTPKPSAISANNNSASTIPPKKARFSSNTPTIHSHSIDNSSSQLPSSIPKLSIAPIPKHSIASIPKNIPISPEKDEWLDLEADLDAVLSDSAPTEASPTPKDSSLLIHRKSLIDDSDDEDLFEEVLEPKADFKNSNNTSFELTHSKSQSSENSNQNLSELFNDDYSDNENDFEFEEVIPEPISGS